ncbi:MAG: FxLYD domain-containing protein [Campylobacterales bacterium]
MRNPLPALITLVRQHKREALAALFVLLFLLLLLLSLKQGTKGFGRDDANDSQPPRALETSFERWYRGDEDQLLASFFLFNHSEKPVKQVEITCAAYSADDREVGRYRQWIKVTLLPGEVRHLSKTFMGKLDPLAQRAVCRIESWE